jgi:hypothetical protein
LKSYVRAFMSACGLLPPHYDDMTLPVFIEGVALLVPLLQEELNELDAAIKANDVVEVTDAFVDLKYFLSQLEIWLEQAGVDVQQAEELVCFNNELKYTTVWDQAVEWGESVGFCKVFIDENIDEDGITQYCIKDNVTHKVKKYKDFPQVDLSPCVPKYLTNYAKVHDCKLPTGNMFKDIKTHQEYNDLVKSGLAFEIYPNLPMSWESFVCERVKCNLEKGENV